MSHSSGCLLLLQACCSCRVKGLHFTLTPLPCLTFDGGMSRSVSTLPSGLGPQGQVSISAAPQVALSIHLTAPTPPKAHTKTDKQSLPGLCCCLLLLQSCGSCDLYCLHLPLAPLLNLRHYWWHEPYPICDATIPLSCTFMSPASNCHPPHCPNTIHAP